METMSKWILFISNNTEAVGTVLEYGLCVMLLLFVFVWLIIGTIKIWQFMKD